MITVCLIQAEAINVNANNWKSAEDQDIGIILEYLPPNMNQLQRERVKFRWRNLADANTSSWSRSASPAMRRLRSHTPPYVRHWEEQGTVSVVSLTKMEKLSLIMRKYQTDPGGLSPYNTYGVCTSIKTVKEMGNPGEGDMEFFAVFWQLFLKLFQHKLFFKFFHSTPI